MKPIKIKNIHISPTQNQLAHDAAAFFTGVMRQFIEQNGLFNVALSGGSTPLLLYRKLVAEYPDEAWNRVNFFWSDERHVPQKSPESNAGTAIRQFLGPLRVPVENVHPLRTELGPAQTAADYEWIVRKQLAAESGIPRFDLILLGVGTDGHTASLFPGTEALLEKSKLVTENWVGPAGMWRITFTFPLINRAKNILFLVSGADKQEIIKRLLTDNNQDVPASHIDPVDGLLHWYVDKAAARHYGS